MKHLLSIEELLPQELTKLIDQAVNMKTRRGNHEFQPLAGQTWALIFTKASTRTRVSFEVGIRELGGSPMFLSKNDIQLGRGEPIKDTARVLGRMVHGAIIRTFAQDDVVQFAKYGTIPTINALTDDEHPCQILADLLTIRERLGTWEGKKIAFVGDGYSNMSISWMWAAKHLGFELTVAGPAEHLPPTEFLKKLNAPNVNASTDVEAAVAGAHAINTDVWLSMGAGRTNRQRNPFRPLSSKSSAPQWSQRRTHRSSLPTSIPRKRNYGRRPRTTRRGHLPTSRK